MNDLVHYAAGVLVAGLMGLSGRRRALVALFAVLPDVDVVTSFLVPFLLDAVTLPRGVAHGLVVALGHGAGSHTVWAFALMLGVAWAAGLRGASWVAAALALASHLVLDAVLTWSVWPLWPLASRGVAWGVVTSGDVVVTSVAAVIVLLVLGLDVRAWRARRRGDAGPSTRAKAGPFPSLLMAAAFALVVAGPAGLQESVLAEHARAPGAVADPVDYRTFVVVEPAGDEAVRLVLVRVGEGVLAERVVPREEDRTGGMGGVALDVAARALVDAPAPSPLVRPLLVARAGERPGEVVVEAREAATLLASEVLGKSATGLDLTFDAEGRVRRVDAVAGERVSRLPVEGLPTWVPVVR